MNDIVKLMEIEINYMEINEMCYWNWYILI